MCAALQVQSSNIYQDVLIRQLKVIFPNEKPLINVRKETKFKYAREASRFLELDVYYSKYNICFEFQDNYHYITTWYNQKPVNQIQADDNIKKDIIQRTGLSLIVVPCWWDGAVKSLTPTIWFQRPDLVPHTHAAPIPLNPPYDFFKSIVPGVGELMQASFPLASRAISRSVWWLGEKYDGVRYCWNPIRKKLYSRHSNEFAVLPSIVALLPPMFTEGEFWFGRGFFPLTITLVNKLLEYVAWDFFRMIVFDTPPVRKQNNPFEIRYEELMDNVPTSHPFTFVAPRFQFKRNMSHNFFIQVIVSDGGEGIILRKCGSLYEHGRSFSLLKLKSVFGDMEGIVIGISRKSVHLQLPNGTSFSVPAEDVQTQKLVVGDIVTFSYENHTRRNVLVNPKISRLRTDVSWQNIIENFKNQIATNAYLQDYRFEHWTTVTMRKFMENFAIERNLDPLASETWYNINQMELCREKKGRMILRNYGTYSQAVQTLFPEIQFDEFTLNSTIWNYSDRRSFFEQIAEQHGFDPLNPEHWYLHRGKLLSSKYTKQVTNYYNQSITKALLDLFPEIGLDKGRLIRSGSQYKRLNRRRYFEGYAKTVGFDPLKPDNWYLQPKEAIMNGKRIGGTLKYHGRSLATALLELFPEIGLVRRKLVVAWIKHGTGRKLFEDYAKAKRFDPLNHESWYLQSKTKIKLLKGAAGVLRFYSNSVAKALIDLFPDVTFDKSRLLISWKKPESRRDFLEKYARGCGFDPLVAENWYMPPVVIEKNGETQWKLATMKGIRSMLSYHSNSAAKALFDLFPDIGLDKAKLDMIWKKPDYKRRFFENYAKEQGFDPLIAENWYSSSIKNQEVKGLRTIISYYTNNVSKALSALFPEIGFDRAKFWGGPPPPRNHRR